MQSSRFRGTGDQQGLDDLEVTIITLARRGEATRPIPCGAMEREEPGVAVTVRPAARQRQNGAIAYSMFSFHKVLGTAEGCSAHEAGFDLALQLSDAVVKNTITDCLDMEDIALLASTQTFHSLFSSIGGSRRDVSVQFSSLVYPKTQFSLPQNSFGATCSSCACIRSMVNDAPLSGDPLDPHQSCKPATGRFPWHDKTHETLLKSLNLLKSEWRRKR